MYEFTYVPTSGDRLAPGKYILTESSEGKPLMRTLKLGVTLFCLLLLGLLRLLSAGDVTMIAAGALLAVICLLWAACAERIFTAFINYGMLVGTRSTGEAVTLRFGDGSITVGEKGGIEIGYSSVSAVSSGCGAVCLFCERFQPLILPDRVFGGDTERSEFISFIKSKTDG